MRKHAAAAIFAGLGFVLAAMVVGVAPAGAAEATGCTGQATSLDSNGRQLDTASAPGTGGTQDNPLTVDPQGSVNWSYELEHQITNGSWEVTLGGSVPLKFGGDFGDSHPQSDSGTENLSQHFVKDLPLLGKTVLVTGLVRVDINASGVGGSCAVHGWIEIDANPLQTPVFYVGLLSLLIGGVLVGFALPTPR